MKVFKDQLNLTMHFEGFSAKAYRCPGGILTIGYGTTRINGNAVTEGMTCTETQAREWLKESLTDLYLWAFRNMSERSFFQSENVRDAISDYAYNCGKLAFPALLKKINAVDVQGASLEFLDGIYVAKKPFLGLLLRRISEYNTFTTGQYVAFEKGDPISQDLKNKLLAKNAKNQDAVNMINQLGVK